MMGEIRELGFARVELATECRFPSCREFSGRSMKGSSKWQRPQFLSAPVEADRAAPNFFQPSAKVGKESRAWLRQSLQTLELAKRVGASHVVMHSGSVFFRFRCPASVLDSGSDADEGHREKALVRLRKRSRVATDRVEARFRDLLEHAAPPVPRLAVENREGTLELPLDEELADSSVVSSPGRSRTGTTPGTPRSNAAAACSIRAPSWKSCRTASPDFISTMSMRRAAIIRRLGPGRSISGRWLRSCVRKRTSSSSCIPG